MRTKARRAASVVTGALCALLFAEVLARRLDVVAPAVYRADPIFGVTLQSGVCGFFRSRAASVTEICTDAMGMRTSAAWSNNKASPGDALAGNAGPRHAPRRVLVVGDSQVLGFGVPWAKSLLPQLRARLPGSSVYAIGVPTWGPIEYADAVRVYGKAVRATDVVIVLNATNDFEEANIPNRERTTARDGFAVSALSRASPQGFAEGLFRQSHLASSLARGLRLQRGGDATMGANPPSPAMNLFVRRDEYLRGVDRFRTRIGRSLQRAQRVAVVAGQRLQIVILPADVQVDPREWDKYRGPAIHPRATLALLEAAAADARELGLGTRVLLSDLAKAEPGVFLPDDYHLSGRGQGILARNIAELVGASSQLDRVIARSESPQGVRP